MRSAIHSARNARAITQIARTAVPVADPRRIDDEVTDENMTNESVTAQPYAPPSSDVPVPPRAHGPAIAMLTVSWIILLAIIVMAAVRIQRWELAPGEAMPVSDRIGFMPITEGGSVPDRYVNDKGIRFVTAFGGQMSILDAVVGWLDPNVRVDTKAEHFGEQSPKESRRTGFQAMVSAKQVAEYVAMKKLGYDARVVEGTAMVQDVVCTNTKKDDMYSGCKALHPGDTITSIDDVETPDISSVVAAIKDRKVGEYVTLGVIPFDLATGAPDPDKQDTVQIRLMESPDTKGKAIIGFVPVDTRKVELPFEVNILTTDIGGPSAGLAFTLALIDELTKGDLTGKGKVAVTGTINADGTVGAIGALRQKAVAVRDAGCSLFLVPAGQTKAEVAQARKAAGKGVRIVQVGTLEQALAALRANGGTGI